MTTYSERTERAIKAYGMDTCAQAYRLHCQGEGARTVGIYLHLTTRQADCAIDAGREMTGIIPNTPERSQRLHKLGCISSREVIKLSPGPATCGPKLADMDTPVRYRGSEE